MTGSPRSAAAPSPVEWAMMSAAEKEEASERARIADILKREALNAEVDRQRAAKMDHERRGGMKNRKARRAAAVKRRKAR